MSISIAQSRQQFAALVVAAQTVPQVITKHNAPVAVLVSADYFKRTEATSHQKLSVYDTLMALRAEHFPLDEAGLSLSDRTLAWTRANSFGDEQ